MSNQRTIPSLDGLRAVAIMLVIVCHLQASVPGVLPMIFVERCGSLGVNIFFVISGFLITHLLLREADQQGGINLKRFYVRRAYRIFPPFYAYLAVVAVMRWFHPQLFAWRSFISAATYTWNYNLHAEGWLLGHTWSLSLEEQFYLLWPGLLSMMPKRTGLRFALTVIMISPLLRVAVYATCPALRGHIDMMLPTHLDTLMVGCAMALMANLGDYEAILNACAKPAWVVVSAFLLTLVCPLLEQRYRGAFYLPLGITLTSLSCGVVVLYGLRQAASPLGRFLNPPWMKHIGVISYSLYLWQQLFTGERTRWFPLSLVLIFLCAESSYWLVEKPSFRIRDYFSRRGVQRTSSVLDRDLLGQRAS